MESARAHHMRLIQRLDAVTRRIDAAFQTLPPDLVVFLEAGWTVKDMAGHLADWQREVVQAFQAYKLGSIYTIAGYTDDDSYNHQRVQARATQTIRQAVQEWRQIQAAFRLHLAALEPAMLAEDMVYPWRVRGTIAALIEEMLAHDEVHLRDMLKAQERADETHY